MSTNVLTPVLIALVIPAVLALFRRLIPFAPPRTAGAPSLEALQARYRKWEAFAVVPLFAFAGSTGYLWYRALRLVAAWAAPAAAPDEPLLLPSPDFWGLPAVFLGIVSSAAPTALLYRFLLGARGYAEYTLYGNLKHGFDGWRAFAGLAVVVAVLAGGLVALGLDHHAKFGQDGIAVNRFFGFGEATHRYEEVVSVKAVARFRAPSGNVVVRPHVAIEFRDGSRWTSRDGLNDRDPATDARVAEYVAARAGVPIDRVDLLE